MESLKKMASSFVTDSTTTKWVYEYNFGQSQDPRGPYHIEQLEIKSDKFIGKGKEESDKF